MDSILELLLTSWIDPVMWFKSMSVLGYKKGKQRCVIATIMYYLFIVAKGLSGIYVKSRAINIMIVVVLTICMFIVTIIWFAGNLKEKIIITGLFYCILFVSELIVIHLFLACTHGSWKWVMTNHLANTICSIIAKSLQVAIFYWLFGKKTYKNLLFLNQEVILVFIVLSSMIGNIVVVYTNIENGENIVVFSAIIRYLLLCYILVISMILDGKDKYISDLNQEVSSNLERKELLQDLEHFKHDYAAHGSIMMNLLYCQEYDKLEEYMKSVFTNVEKAEEFYDHPNIIVAILISELTQQAKKVHILFTARIQVDDFGMKDEEICSLLHNIVINGIEATIKVPRDMAQVSLQVLYIHSGYEIRCLNPCIGVVDFKKTSKKNKKKHGFGVTIVDKIVKRYHGTIERVCKETTVDGIGLVVVSIHIPLEHKKILY